MYSRFLSVFGLLVFVFFSSNTVFAQTFKQYNFPNDIYGFHHVWNSRDAAGCPTGQGGTAVMPNHAATGEALCDQEAQRLGINKEYMRWYMSPVFATWSSPGDNKLCRYQGGKMQIVNGTTGGGKWTNIVVCKYEPFDCGDRWGYELVRGGPQNLSWQLNWDRTKEPADYKRVGAHNFKCMPRTCTGTTCPGVPVNTRDECFLTDEPGEYRRLNGTLCACPASKEKVGNQCVVDQCTNITGVQATVPAGTTKSGANCNCNNGATDPATCTTCPTGQTMVSGQCTTLPTNLPQCSDGLDNDGDGKIDFGGANADPDCTSATDNTESSDLVCPAGTTRKPTPASPVCFLTATPTTSPAGTAFSLTGYSHLSGTCTLASTTTHNTPTTPILRTAPSLTLSVSSTGALTINATTTGTFTAASQLASLLTCPQGSASCSIGTGGVISCGCYNTGVTAPTIVTSPIYECVSNLCAEGQYYCSAEDTCKSAGQPCSPITCDYDTKCEVGESCNCSDCTQGNLLNDKDQCGLSSTGEQLYCTRDSVVANNTTFPFCLPACLDGQACTTTCKQQVGACCPAGSQWNSTANSCVPMTCGKGEFYCAAQKKCLPGGTTCEPGTPVTCVNNGVCEGEESCQCADCVNGGTDDKDKCSIIGGIQAMCSDDNLTDNLPGACCIPPEKWDTATKTCKACSNTQAPSELKANYDQPYITCTGNGVVADTHFRYMIKQGTTVVMTSDIYPNSTQVLHPKMAAGTYTVQCFYGNATAVNTTGTATPHTCEKTMTVKDANENAVQGCNRVYAYKGSTLSDELTSNTSFDASFRCGARLTSVDTPNPFALHIGTIAPQFLITDTFMTSFLGEFDPPIGALSTQTQNHRFNTGSTPVACAVRVGGGYSTNDYCRATACVGDNCNVPQAFSVVHSDSAECSSTATSDYHIGCNSAASDEIRNACVEMFQEAINNITPKPQNGVPFRVKMLVNGVIANGGLGVECTQYAPGTMPGGANIFGTVSCLQELSNGEFYELYAADVNGNKINSLQTQTRTVERDDMPPVLEDIKYYTDSSLTTLVPTGTWSNKPVTALAVCRDTPTTESASCACAPLVHDSTTDKSEWTRGVNHGPVNVGADLLRYTRVISERVVDQDVVVVDTAGNKSTPVQKVSAYIDTEAPVVTPTTPNTGSTRDVTLTATDNVSKIWKTTAAPSGATNTSGIIWRKGLKANLSSLTFDEECGVTPSFATVSETGVASFPTTATVTIPAVNMTTEVVTYCIRDNAGNTTRGIYPVVTDACFSATNMSPIPTFGNYKTLTNTRLGGSGTNNQKYGYSFSENQSNAACFRGILATNIQTFVANQLEPRTTTTLTNWDTDRAPTKANTSVLNTNGYYYYKYSGNTLNLRTSPSPTDTGTKSVIVDGGDIHIKENINYSGPGKTLLLIARRNVTGQGGNIIIDTTVTNIDAILIADGGALKSSNASAPGERLTINGRIYSYNTRGGSLQPSGTTDLINATTPQIFSASGSLIAAPSLADAQMQDLERFRPSFVGESQCSLHLNYYAYTTATLPLLLQRPVGYTGGNCGF